MKARMEERLLSVCAPLKIFTTATAKKEDKLARLSFPHDAVIKNECRRSKNSKEAINKIGRGFLPGWACWGGGELLLSLGEGGVGGLCGYSP